jgi:stearoyl-CoA desaturase (delta-9 desaturase)
MSHPVHGWMVNSLAHKYGYRNFATKDHSTNNTFVSWLVAGEGLQNNHHARPKSANFAKKKGEIDLGYSLCVISSRLGLIKLKPAS